MFKPAVIFVSLVLIVGGDIYDICTSLQWEGIQFVVTGTEEAGIPTMIQNLIQFSFDANNSRIAASTSGFQDGHQFQKDFLFLYQQKTVYVIEEGKCHAEYLDNAFPPHCLPSNFTWTWWRTWYGFPKMDGQLWIFGYVGHVNDLQYHVQLFLEFMTPASHQIFGKYNNEPFYQTTEVVNTTRGIKNPDVFSPPPSCKDAKPQGTYKTPVYLLGATFPRESAVP
ncbi:uncharacterized protein LOC124286604 isoform X1 [Haliotis rubra]|uniref:uncharacterized protein LOC124286604 isoform X1 n=1 Tax=Haliotis rubra TaxID=36100 RepID=UPI001EE518AF|nr:uncharacterized protein LOC124286604 isoform X1 [Haliotis rubra]